MVESKSNYRRTVVARSPMRWGEVRWVRRVCTVHHHLSIGNRTAVSLWMTCSQAWGGKNIRFAWKLFNAAWTAESTPCLHSEHRPGRSRPNKDAFSGWMCCVLYIQSWMDRTGRTRLSTLSQVDRIQAQNAFKMLLWRCSGAFRVHSHDVTKCIPVYSVVDQTTVSAQSSNTVLVFCCN